MNKVVAGLDRELGWLWDKKKESFARRRLTAYLLEDRTAANSKQQKGDASKKKHEAAKDGWLSDAFPITDKQNLVIYGTNPCLRRQLAIDIRTQILKMLHFLPRVVQNQFLSPSLCKDLMLKEKEAIRELTDQARPISEQLGLRNEEYCINYKEVLDCNLQALDKLTIKL
jgi:hypothetical protein